MFWSTLNFLLFRRCLKFRHCIRVRWVHTFSCSLVPNTIIRCLRLLCGQVNFALSLLHVVHKTRRKIGICVSTLLCFLHFLLLLVIHLLFTSFSFILLAFPCLLRTSHLRHIKSRRSFYEVLLFIFAQYLHVVCLYTTFP